MKVCVIRKMVRLVRICRRQQDGQAMIEFGLIAPILLLVLTGIFTFGFVLNQYELLTNAVSDGARAFAMSRNNANKSMAANQDPCAYAITAIESAAPTLKASNMTFTIVYTPSGGSGASYSTTCSGLTMAQGDNVSVKVVYPVTAFVVSWGTKTLNLTAQTQEFIQ